MTNSISSNLQTVRNQITAATSRYDRPANSVQLLAVSKTRTPDEIREALKAGQRCFGESYLQEAIAKIGRLLETDIEWHFIGQVQSNKTKLIAENFDWVHSIAKIKHAQRLNDQRPASLPPLNVCLQIRIGDEESKGGIDPQQTAGLIRAISKMPRLRLRGLMTLPPPEQDLAAQRQPFRALRVLRDQLATEELTLETLSMGMSGDMEAAIAEGATIVRVGTAIFGPRNR